jgi:hypothetical protein
MKYYKFLVKMQYPAILKAQYPQVLETIVTATTMEVAVQDGVTVADAQLALKRGLQAVHGNAVVVAVEFLM